MQRFPQGCEKALFRVRAFFSQAPPICLKMNKIMMLYSFMALRDRLRPTPVKAAPALRHGARRIPAWIVAGVALPLLAGLLSCADTAQPPVAPKPAEGSVRDFVLKDTGGAKFRLSEQRGKPVLLIFGATWCATCRSEIPRYKRIYDIYAPRGLVVVNIDVDEPLERVARFAERHQLPYRVLLDENGRVAEAYQIVGVPTLMLIDRDGRLISRQYQAIEGLLEQLFKN